MNLGRIDKINKTTLSLTALDLTLGLLAIAFVSVGTATASTVSSLGSLLFILAVFKTYKSLKQGAEKNRRLRVNLQQDFDSNWCTRRNSWSRGNYSDLTCSNKRNRVGERCRVWH